MSKSRGNVIYPKTFVDRYGSDAYRYYILREFPTQSDTICTPLDFINRYNSDLVNDFGNLVSRSLSMANKYFNGHVENKASDNEFIKDLEKMSNDVVCEYKEDMDSFKIDKALADINKLVSRTNKFIDETAPWALFKSGDMELLESVIYHLLEAIRIEAILYVPYLVKTTPIIFDCLGLDNLNTSLNELKMYETKEYNIKQLQSPLFPRESDVDKSNSELIKSMEEELNKEN